MSALHLEAAEWRTVLGLPKSASRRHMQCSKFFGQKAVVDRLLENSADQRGERREVCVMFLHIRNFTANSREHTPDDVVEYSTRHLAR